LLVRKHFGKLNHPPQIFVLETPAVLGAQLSPYRCDDSLPVGCALLAENFRADALTNLPVQHGQRRVRSAGDATSGVSNEMANVVEKGRLRASERSGLSTGVQS
jgi:hypothetical protein